MCLGRRNLRPLQTKFNKEWIMAAKKLRQNRLDSFIDGQYQSLDNKVKFFVLLLAIVIPLAGMYYAVYEPNIEEQKGLKEQIADVNQEIQKAKETIANMPAFMAKLAETQRKFDESLVNIPKTNEIPKLLRTISDLGKAAGLEFLSFAPGPEVPQEFYAEIPISISLYGPYHSVGTFLDKLSKLDRIVTLDSLSMATPKQENDEILLTSTGTLVTYRSTVESTATPQSQTGK